MQVTGSDLRFKEITECFTFAVRLLGHLLFVM